MKNIFLTAARKRFRFDSVKGERTTEELFTLPLTSKSGFDLDTIAKTVNRQLKAQAEESFVETSNNPLKAELEEKLEVVTTVIGIIKAENEAARLKRSRLEEAHALRDALASAKARKLGEASEEDLEKRLAELEASIN
jgi:hypothetical protein